MDIIHFVEMCKYLEVHPVPQCEMVEVKSQGSSPPPASTGAVREETKTESSEISSLDGLFGRLDAMKR